MRVSCGCRSVARSGCVSVPRAHQPRSPCFSPAILAGYLISTRPSTASAATIAHLARIAQDRARFARRHGDSTGCPQDRARCEPSVSVQAQTQKFIISFPTFRGGERSESEVRQGPLGVREGAQGTAGGPAQSSSVLERAATRPDAITGAGLSGKLYYGWHRGAIGCHHHSPQVHTPYAYGTQPPLRRVDNILSGAYSVDRPSSVSLCARGNVILAVPIQISLSACMACLRCT
ncbi:hypothetical protein K466DRAFT_392995 [Polyporus arcularius HHB13444]|uniref:Uncharacterized protein n=1 Tax=Polyporus arcularius HHB13444 TaxID=1314778 RepID=A0A5C3PPT1_9APHY|nr:hypothetical protein K466DRAFT_392995 [Polyporus arcularius HHB13444]